MIFYLIGLFPIYIFQMRVWIEPEMINTRSELYEKHPDWVMKVPGQDFITARGGTQAVLDLTNPQVRDFIFYTVDTLLARYPEIEYIKWDAICRC